MLTQRIKEEQMPQSEDRLLKYNAEESVSGPLNQLAIINSLIGKMHTATLVQIKAVNGNGVNPVGFVDVLPLVQQTDAEGRGINSVTIYNLPYFRLQGGANAVIIDPQVDDIGLAIFASRDISKTKRTKKEGPPSTRRQYDLSDGLYLGGYLNQTPSQYIHFLDGGGINAVATGEFNIKASKIVLDAPVETTSTVESAGDITDNKSDGNAETMASMRKTYNTHNHIDSTGGTTKPPNQKV